MITIPETFNLNGYRYRLLKRSKRVAMYEQLGAAVVLAYEVVKIAVAKATEARVMANGRTMPAMPEREKLPNDQEWGDRGKTFTTSAGKRRQAAISEAEAQYASWCLLAE